MQPWIYIALLGFAALLYALMLPAHGSGKGTTAKEELNSLEETLTLFISDMERENDDMLKLIGAMKEQVQSGRTAQGEQIAALQAQLGEIRSAQAQLETRMAAGEDRLLQLAMGQAETAAASAPDRASANRTEEENLPERPAPSIRPRYPQLFEMHDQGKSVDSIAKATGMQRGEVQLILQLARQEENA